MSSQANSGLSALRRNSKDARWLGVCAGVADWLDIPVALVRVIFVICVLTWPTLIIGYFILYFVLSDEDDSQPVKDFFHSKRPGRHFREVNYRKPIHKNESNKRIAGVCSGIADYFEVSPFVVRMATLGSLFIFGPFTFWAYVICAFVFDPDPNTSDTERYKRKMAKRQRRRDRRAKRYSRMGARRSHTRGVRKSYPNEEFNASMDDLESEISELVEGELHDAFNEESVDEQYDQPSHSFEECKEIYRSMELRLRDVEAFMTSSKFRLHCEINRI